MGLKNLSARYMLLCNRDIVVENDRKEFTVKYLCSMNKIKAAIIEDEIPAARLLRDTLLSLRPDWEVQLLPGNIEEAVEWFGQHPHPDILFLDIQLTDGNSFFYRTGASGEYDCIYYCL